MKTNDTKFQIISINRKMLEVDNRTYELVKEGNVFGDTLTSN